MSKFYALLLFVTVLNADTLIAAEQRGQKRKRPDKEVRFSEKVTYFPVRPEEAEGLLDYIEQKKSHISYVASMEKQWRVERLKEALRAKNSAKLKEKKRIRSALSSRVKDSLVVWLVRARLRIIDGKEQNDNV